MPDASSFVEPLAKFLNAVLVTSVHKQLDIVFVSGLDDILHRLKQQEQAFSIVSELLWNLEARDLL